MARSAAGAAMALVLASVLACATLAGAVNRCGTSYSNAGTKCRLCPRGIDSECPAGERCYAGLPSCTSPPPSGGTVNRCGTSFSNAGTKCSLCPRGIDSECPAGNRCYAGLPACGGSPPGPTPPSGCGSLSNPHSHISRSASGSCEYCFNPQMKFVVDKLKCAYPPIGNACGTYASSSSTSDHPGNAADCEPTGNPIGVCPDATERAAGWAAANWLKANAVPLGISYVIWDARIWSRARSSEGWRQYNGYSQGACTTANRAVTNGHYDHIHISMYPSLA